MNYPEFHNKVHAAGLVPRQCTPEHWQIRGGALLVNFYPFTKRGQRFYVDGSARGACGELSKAIIAAKGACPLQPTKKSNSKSAVQRRRRAKKRLLQSDPHCHYCRKPLDMQSATLDHSIPVSKGGGDFGNNYRLACQRCNSKKADAMPALTPEPEAAGEKYNRQSARYDELCEENRNLDIRLAQVTAERDALDYAKAPDFALALSNFLKDSKQVMVCVVDTPRAAYLAEGGLVRLLEDIRTLATKYKDLRDSTISAALEPRE